MNNPSYERLAKPESFLDSIIVKPLKLWAFHTNREQLNLLFHSCSEKIIKRKIRKNIQQSIYEIFVNKKQRYDFIMRSHLSVILAIKLVGNMKNLRIHALRIHAQRIHALRILSRQHYFDNKQCELLKIDIDTAPEQSIRSLAFHPTLPLLITCSLNDRPILYRFSHDCTSFTAMEIKIMHSNINFATFHPILPLIATNHSDNSDNSDNSEHSDHSDHKAATLWRISANDSVFDLTFATNLVGHIDSVMSIAFHPTAPLLATSSADKTTKIWRFSPDGSLATCAVTLEGHSCSIWSVAFHPLKPFMATGSKDKTTKLWSFLSDGTEATCVATLERHTKAVRSVAFHPIRLLLATGSYDGTTKLWHFSCDGRNVTCVAILPHDNSVFSVTFHSTAPLLASGSLDNTTKLWNISKDSKTVTHVKTLQQIHAVHSVAFHRTLPILGTGGFHGTIKLWR
jgi:WD40 repeat protein